jgi:hypothetical protein
MRTSFFTWLETRDHRPEAPEATRLTQIIAAAGPAGVRLRDLRKAVKLDRDTVNALLSGLTAVGQVVVAKVAGGEMVFYALS